MTDEVKAARLRQDGNEYYPDGQLKNGYDRQLDSWVSEGQYPIWGHAIQKEQREPDWQSSNKRRELNFDMEPWRVHVVRQRAHLARFLNR